MISLDKKKIKILIHERDYGTQKRLAHACGWHEQYLSVILNKKSHHGLTLGTLNTLCSALRCNLFEIVTHVLEDSDLQTQPEEKKHTGTPNLDQTKRPRRKFRDIAVDDGEAERST